MALVLFHVSHLSATIIVPSPVNLLHTHTHTHTFTCAVSTQGTWTLLCSAAQAVALLALNGGRTTLGTMCTRTGLGVHTGRETHSAGGRQECSLLMSRCSVITREMMREGEEGGREGEKKKNLIEFGNKVRVTIVAMFHYNAWYL